MPSPARILLWGALAICCTWPPTPVFAQFIASVDFDPRTPATGDPAALLVTLLIPQDCDWKPEAVIAFGSQPELEPLEGWGIDLALRRQTVACSKPFRPFNYRVDLGFLPVASGPGVLRVDIDERLFETAFFDLTVVPGPAPGWQQPAVHGTLPLFLASAGLEAVGEGVLAISDLIHREIVLFDPISLETLDAFRAPGAAGLARGLAFDGAALYVSSDEVIAPPRIYRVALDGTVLLSFPSPTFAPARRPLEGLAFLDGVLYGTHESPPVLFAMNPATGALLWQRPLPVRILGLTAVPRALLGVEPNGVLLRIAPSPFGFDDVVGDPVDIGLAGTPDGVDLTGLAFDGIRTYAWDASSSLLRFIRPLSLWWLRDGTLFSYLPPEARGIDVIRSRAGQFRFLSGNVGIGPSICLVSEGKGGVVPADEDPPVGQAFVYLERIRSPTGFKTSYGRSSFGFRRIETDPLSGACP